MADQRSRAQGDDMADEDDWKDCARPLTNGAITTGTFPPGSTVVIRGYPPEALSVGISAAEKIRRRLAEKREEYAEYLAHAKIRLREEDLHGLWDCGANASEVSNYIDGLVYALEALGEKP